MAATLALVLAMSGGALAASHYLISSTRQISPAVLKKLHGARGARGLTGSIGPIGPQGPTGEAGPKGGRGPTGLEGFSALSLLPGGATESGDFAVGAPAATAGQAVIGSISFPIPLGTRIPVEHVMLTTPSSPVEHCAAPGLAGRGYLCIYVATAAGVETPLVTDPEATPVLEGSGRFGFALSWTATGAGAPQALGSYSVTAG